MLENHQSVPFHLKHNTMGNPWDEVIGTDEYDSNLARIEMLANDKGYALNKDTERVEKIIGHMIMNFNASDKYYCPCKQSHPLDPDKDIICPCPEREDEIKQDGSCLCHLFYRK